MNNYETEADGSLVILDIRMTPFEAKVFRRFARNYDPPYGQHPIQLEGNKQLPVIAAGHRLAVKGVLVKTQACRWYMTDLGKKMAVEWKKHNE